ncbi:restriction endonuclease subunit S [Enterococcus faecalis]|uniref:restriction endonuclease subunit S n=1 Tax=Enterococcus faecalis TaxID=1351 RepID=UPI003134249E
MNLLIVFTLIGVWELCKFGEVAKITMGQSPNSKNYTKNPNDYILVQGNADIKNGKVVPRVWTTQLTKQAEKGDLLLSVRAPVGDIGKTEYNVVIGRGIAGIKGNEFVFQQLSKMKDNNYWARYSTGSTFESISSNDIRGAIFFIPEKIEQESIGLFLKNIDNFIVLHQRKLEQLKELKKAYLQVMFPRKDERVPKLRFADFEGEWAQRKLGEISTHRSGTAIERYFTEDGKYKVISIGSYGTDSKYVDQGIRAISNEITNARVVHKGELTMVLNDKTSDGAIIGRSLLIESEEEYVINQRTEIISPKDDFNVNFAYTTLNNTFRQKVKKIVQGGTQIYVNYPAVKNLMLDFPSYKEQTKIGTFFKQFDDTITLHQNKLDQLKTLKKTYLQNMFI